MIKIIRTYLIIVSVFSLNSCYSQKTDEILVIKIEYSNSQYINDVSSTYSLIKEYDLKRFKFVKDTSSKSPNVLYQLTANNGKYISESFTDLFTLGCCKYDDIEIAIEKNYEGELIPKELEEFSKINELSMNLFENNESVFFEFEKENEKYQISVWQAEIKYCLCTLYMENPPQEIYGYEAAYITSIDSIKKPSENIEKEIIKLFEKLINLDY